MNKTLFINRVYDFKKSMLLPEKIQNLTVSQYTRPIKKKKKPTFCYMCVYIHLTLEKPWLANPKNEIK